MATTFSSVSNILINSSKDEVWDAVTNPEKVRRYFFGTQLVTTWQVGSPITFKGEWQNVPYEDNGTVLIYEQPRKLSYEIPDKYGVLTYELDGKDGRTELTISQAGIATIEEQKQSQSNWSKVLADIKIMLEA